MTTMENRDIINKTEYKKEPKQVSDSLVVGILLAIVGGYLDAYTFIARGEVFANAQTGNMVLFGLNMARGNWIKAVYYLIPILAFILGVVIAELIKGQYKMNRRIHWRQIIIAIEIVTLLIVNFIPQGDFNIVANVLISFVCSMQVQGFRKINGNAYATTMCTGNLRSATEHICRYKKTKDKVALHKSLQYYGIIVSFISGAIIGTYLTGIYQDKAVGCICIVLATVLILMFRKERSTEIL